MSDETARIDSARTAAWVLGTLGTLAIMLLLVWAMVRATRPEDIAAARAIERVRFLQEIRQAEAQATNGYAWQNKDKGFVRVPLSRARELVLQEWRQPAIARSNLIARVEKATEIPPPPPVAPSIYE